MFFMLPAWGLSNAAATLVGQNLGAKEIERAEISVKLTIRYNVIFMAIVTIIFYVLGGWVVSFFATDPGIKDVAIKAMRIISAGYVFYGIGMVMMNAFNGAGDTLTPTIIYFFGFWLFQIPFAWLLAKYFELGPTGVFIAVPVSESLITVASYLLFKKGRWKTIKV